SQVVTQARENTVVVPNRAVRTQGRNRMVEVQLADGKTEQRQVQVGLANDQQTEIVSGLQPGDRVIIPGTTTAAPRLGGGAGGAGAFGGGGAPPPGGGPVFVQR